jgi:hypothetical protein
VFSKPDWESSGQATARAMIIIASRPAQLLANQRECDLTFTKDYFSGSGSSLSPRTVPPNTRPAPKNDLFIFNP